MRNATIFLMATALISLFAQHADAQIAWETKLRDAHSKAKASGKLMLLHFYTDNCVFCDRLEDGAFRSASVRSTINDNFVPVKVHGGKNPKLAKMFKVSKYPTDVIVTTEGKALSHSVSPQQPDRYIAMLGGAKATFVKSQAMLAAADGQAAGSQAGPAATASAAAPTTAAKAAVESPQSAPSPTAGISLPSESLAARSLPSESLAAQSLPSESLAAQSKAAAAPAMTLPKQVAAVTAKPSQPQQNQFVLPESAETSEAGKPAVVDASLASVRRESKTTAPPATRETLDLAIEGFCPVSVVNKGQWVEGKTELGVVHLGKLYLFADEEAMQLFLANPIPFTPMLNEIDVVRFFEEKKIVPGKREWGLIDPVHNRMFFFADEAAMLHFEKTFERYLDAAIEVMDHAIEEANPGV